MLIIKLTVSARNDLQEGARYYNQQQAGLERKFRTRVKQTLTKISRAPKQPSIAFDNVRYKRGGKVTVCRYLYF